MGDGGGLTFRAFSLLAERWTAEVEAETDEQVTAAADGELPPVGNGMSDELVAYFAALEKPDFATAESERLATEMDEIYRRENGGDDVSR